jgi:hypothetical protein
MHAVSDENTSFMFFVPGFGNIPISFKKEGVGETVGVGEIVAVNNSVSVHVIVGVGVTVQVCVIVQVGVIVGVTVYVKVAVGVRVPWFEHGQKRRSSIYPEKPLLAPPHVPSII